MAESPENCLRKIQSGLPLKSKEIYSRYGLEQNQFFRITTDKHGDPQFELLVRIDPMMVRQMVIKGRFSSLDSQRTLVFGEIRSWALGFLTFMMIASVIFLIAALSTNAEPKAVLCGLINTPFIFYINFERRKAATLFLVDTLKQALES